jgi:glutamyl-tRNA reductase
VAEDNLQERSGEAVKAEQIVNEEVQGFARWIAELEQAPTITALRRHFEEIRRREIDKSLGGGLKDLSEQQRAALDDMTNAMVNKMLHGPISHIKRNSQDDEEESALYVAALKKLFDLEGK